jgi:hypothetical protein
MISLRLSLSIVLLPGACEMILALFGCPAEPIWLDNLELILYLLDISLCLMFLIFTSGDLGEQLSSLVSFFICLDMDSPLIILGEAIVLTGLEF